MREGSRVRGPCRPSHRSGGAKLYEIGRLSSGKAARLAGMDRMTFLRELDRVGVPAINLRDEQIEAEIREARELAG